jgi:hypothetical protein
VLVAVGVLVGGVDEIVAVNTTTVQPLSSQHCLTAFSVAQLCPPPLPQPASPDTSSTSSVLSSPMSTIARSSSRSRSLWVGADGSLTDIAACMTCRRRRSQPCTGSP